MNKKVNKIFLKLEIEGKGLVNYNGDRPPKRFLGQMYHEGKVVKAGSFGKEHVYLSEIKDKDGNKKVIEIPKKIISSNLIRKEIVGDENYVNAHKLSEIPKLRIAFISQDNTIARGFMFAGRSQTFKRKGAITVTDAEQTSDTVTSIEIRTKEGERDENSMHFKETCGEIKYESEIAIDVKQLQFVSIDDNYDRMALTEKDAAGFIEHIDNRYGKENALLGNWATNHLNVIGEQGIVLSPLVASNIIRKVINGVLNFNVNRAGSYAKTSTVKVAFGYKGEEIDLLVEPDYNTINSISDYDELAKDIEIGVDFFSIEPNVIEKKEKKVKVKA